MTTQVLSCPHHAAAILSFEKVLKEAAGLFMVYLLMLVCGSAGR